MKKRETTAFVSVIYPAAAPFIDDFSESLLRQTDRHFDVIIANDGHTPVPPALAELAPKIYPVSGQAAKIRKTLLEQVIADGYDVVVFGDSDDWFAENRMAHCKMLLKDNSLIFNELVSVFAKNDVGIPLLRRRVQDGQTLTAQDIFHGNALGLGNTAVRTHLLAPYLSSIPDDTLAFDWMLFAQVLSGGVEARFTTGTHSFYRQHEGTMADITAKALTNDHIRRGLTVKQQHYCALKDLGQEYASYCSAFGTTAALAQKTPKAWQEYCDFIREKAPAHPLWWEAIRPWPEKEDKPQKPHL